MAGDSRKVEYTNSSDNPMYENGENTHTTNSGKTRKHAHKSNKKFKVLIILATILLFLVVAGFFANKIYQDYKFTNQIPSEIRDSAQFPLYFPDKLPDGFIVDKSKLSGSEQAVIFSVLYDNGNKELIFSVQPKPAQFSIDEFQSKRFVDPQNYFINGQRVVVGELASVKTASMFTDATWILVKAPDGINTDDLVAVVGSLRAL